MYDCEWNEEVGYYICTKCGNKLDYNKDYDSEYCSKCNEWRIKTCNYPNCKFCCNRPKKPINNKLGM